MCAVCHHVVKGLFVWCQGCSHGGHLQHIMKWLETSSHCPTGCGHLCEYTWAWIERAQWQNWAQWVLGKLGQDWQRRACVCERCQAVVGGVTDNCMKELDGADGVGEKVSSGATWKAMKLNAQGNFFCVCAKLTPLSFSYLFLFFFKLLYKKFLFALLLQNVFVTKSWNWGSTIWMATVFFKKKKKNSLSILN